MKDVPKELLPIIKGLNLSELGFEYLPNSFSHQHNFYAEHHKYKFQISDGIWTVWVRGEQKCIVSTSQQLFIALSELGFNMPQKYLRSGKLDRFLNE